MKNKDTPKFTVIKNDGKTIKRNYTIKKKNEKNEETKHIPFTLILAIMLVGTLSFRVFVQGNQKNIIENSNEPIMEEKSEECVNTIEDNTAATVNIVATSNNKTFTSSGVILGTNDNNQLVILTAKHSTDYDTNFYIDVNFVDGSSCLADGVYQSREHDFSIVIVSLDKISANTLNTIKMAKYDTSREAKYGDDVYVIGKHLEEGLLFYEGKLKTESFIIALEKFNTLTGNIKTDFGVIKGTSGGGLYDKEGYLLGICSKGTDEETVFVMIEPIIESYKALLEEENK